MGKQFEIKLVKNKANGQFNFTIPKKKMSKKMLADLGKSKKIKISIEKFYS